MTDNLMTLQNIVNFFVLLNINANLLKNIYMIKLNKTENY